MSRRWFTSDHHFGHNNILRFQKDTRPFPSILEMDAHMIQMWNKHVSKNDVVYVIGDFSFHRNMDFNKRILSALHGKKILIRGNHDLATTRQLLDTGFDDVRDEIRVKISNGENLLLKHYPYQAPWWIYYTRKLLGTLGAWRNYYVHTPINKGAWLIHGHHHGGAPVKRKMINVNVDTWGFKPVSEAYICSVINAHRENNLLYKISYYFRAWRKRCQNLIKSKKQ